MSHAKAFRRPTLLPSHISRDYTAREGGIYANAVLINLLWAF